MTLDAERFIREHLVLAPVASVPEISIHKAHSGSGLAGRLAEFGVEDPPYWAFAWAGGAALARHILDHPGIVASRRILDLGAGSGIVGIAAAKAGARAVISAETDPFGAAATVLNAEANGVAVAICQNDVTLEGVPNVDLILAGDVFYSATVALKMLGFLRRCQAAGLSVLVGDPGRTDLPTDALRLLARYVVPDVGAAGTGTASAVYALKGL